MNKKYSYAGWLLLVALLTASAPLRAQQAAGEVIVLRGSASAVSVTGATRSLERGAGVFQGDRIDTADGAVIAMEFTDGSTFQLGENASMSVDNYAFGQSAESDGFASSIFKGAFRFVSGLIAQRRSRGMGVRTPVATIGIRGTSVAGEADATSARIMLLEPEEDRPTAIEVSNAFGSVTIDEPGFGTEIPDANSPPSPPRRMQLQTIQNLMRTIQSIGRIRPPRIR